MFNLWAMDILRRFREGKYNTAYIELLKNFRIEDFAVGMKGKTKVILGKENVTVVYGNVSEEIDYDSFIESIKKYNELCKLLEQEKFKKRNPYGVRVYEKGGKKYILGKDLILIWGDTREVFNYDQGILFIKYDLYGI